MQFYSSLGIHDQLSNYYSIGIFFLDTFIGMFDHDKSGTIDATEFAKLWDFIQQWKKVFDSYDKDHSGSIDANELHTGELLLVQGLLNDTTFKKIMIIQGGPIKLNHWNAPTFREEGSISNKIQWKLDIKISDMTKYLI